MRNLKKFLALVLAMLMVVSASAMVSADDFTDVAADNAYAAAINDLAVKGIVAGTSATTFNPDADVQRYQMALFIARATTGEVGDEANNGLWANGIVPFTDVTEYKGAIQHAYLNGIIKGRTDTTFDPAGNIAYVDALTMAVRALGYTDCEYPWGFYNKAVELGLTAGVAVDALYTTLDRAETAQIIYNMIYAKRANSDVSFATENFDLDVVRTTDLFVITATPLQSYANGYEADADVGKGTYVGLQPLVNGVPAGEIMYVPVEKLGIEAADVENYLNYAVELINYDAETGEFYDAKLGAAPDKIYTDKVDFTKVGGNVTNKVTIDGTIYNLVENIGGTALKNELVAFSGADVNQSQAKFLLEDVDGNVYAANGINSVLGTPVAKRIQFSGSNTKFYAVLVADGTNLEAGSVITEAAALDAWGFTTDAVQYTKYATLTAAEIAANPAFELQLFDDDANGLYDRAIVNPVYMTVYGTYEKNINSKKAGKEVCDTLFNTHAVANQASVVDIEAVDMTYSEELEVGTVFTYTYNDITNTVYVIDTLELQTAKLTKIDTKTGADDGIIKYTLGGTVYNAVANGNYTAVELGAIKMPVGDDDLTLENMNKGIRFDTMPDWYDYVDTADLGIEYNFYAVNGYVIYAEPVPEAVGTADKIEFVILDSVNDFDFGALELNVYAGGIETEVVAVNKFKANYEDKFVSLVDLPDWYYTLFLGQTEHFYDGSIYAVTKTADGINILGFLNEDTYTDYKEDTNKDGKLTAADAPILEHISLDDNTQLLDANDTINFNFRGIVSAGTDTIEDTEERILTTSTTVFYFVDYGNETEPNADYENTTIEVFKGIPANGTIELDEYTHIYVDRLGYKKNNATQGSTQLVIVVNAKDWDFGVEVTRDKYGYFVGTESEYFAQTAVDLGLEGYNKDAAFYMYEDAAIDVATGETFTVYAPVDAFEEGKVYEFDANGVVLGYADMDDDADLVGITMEDLADEDDDDKYLNWTDLDVEIDAYVEQGYYNILVGTDLESDHDDYDEYIVKKATLINLGDDVVIERDGLSDLEYDYLSAKTGWSNIVNFFRNVDQLDSLETYAYKVSNNEVIIYVVPTQN